MSVTVRVLEGRPVRALAIPTAAIIHDGEDAHCYVALSANTIGPRALQLGRAQDRWTEVVSGLRPSDQVVTRGALFLDRATEEPSP
jgi:membrane fusion protein, heavy metal efflux system